MIFPTDKDLDAHITAHFRLREFLDRPCEGYPVEYQLNFWRVIESLELLRREAGGRPVVITSGYRTPAWNQICGGAPHSYHLLGLAADIVVPSLSFKELEAIARRYFNGVIRYPRHVHVDLRTEKYWAYSDYKQ